MEICKRCGVSLANRNLQYWSSKRREIVCIPCGSLDGFGLWRTVEENGQFSAECETIYAPFQDVLDELAQYRVRVGQHG